MHWTVERLSRRGDTEHEQSLVRIVIVAALVVYALLGPMPEAAPGWWVPSPLQLAVAVLVVSLVHFVWILIDPKVRPYRRGGSMLVDHAGIVAGMAIGGAPTSLLYPLLLWVTLGHGFRYGRGSMMVSAAISLGLFGMLIVYSPFWSGLGMLNVGLAMALVLIPGYCLRLLTQLHDARRRAEESSQAKSRFLATMSHELRTPLHAILGMTELLRGTPLSTSQRDMARTIHSAGHHLLNMIEDVLDIARIEAGAESTASTTFDLQRLLLEVRDLLTHEAGRKGLALWLRVDPSLPPLVVGARRTIHQVLVNLVANAIKFTDRGEVRIVANRAGHGSDLWLELIVADTGCGIPTDAQSRVFERFTQLDEGETRRHGGTGLGLAIVKQLVDAAGGRIELASTPGKGSSFHVSLPIEPSTIGEGGGRLEEILLHGIPTPKQRDLLEATGARLRFTTPGGGARGAAAGCVDVWLVDGRTRQPVRSDGRELVVLGSADPPEAIAVLPAEPSPVVLTRALRAAVVTAEPPGGDESSLRVRPIGPSLDVLVADDNRVNLQVLERLLGRVGHRVVLAADGAEAVAALRAATFDSAILDLNMPRMGGLAVAAEVSTWHTRPRLIALTADATPEAGETAIAAGFDSYLTKPVESAQLLRALQGEVSPDETGAAPIPVEPERVVIDQSRLDMLQSLDQGDGFVAEVVGTFIDDSTELIAQLQAAAADGDSTRFRDLAHAIRSAATHLGATELFERCLETKTLDDTSLAENAPAIARGIADSFTAVSEALAPLRGGDPGDAASSSLSGVPASTGPGPAAPSCVDPDDRAPEPARSRDW
ncbi:MAG: ATP-binding protein [Pseudomonadota bacterium]